MNIYGESPGYCAYVLRCWEEHPRHDPHSRVQRFSLEDVHTGQRYGFTSIEALEAFLQDAMQGEYEEVRNGEG